MNASIFQDYINLLSESKQTPEVLNALSLAKGCLRYGEDRNINMTLCYGGPSYSEVFNQAINNAKEL